jgi:hypothetical protein
MARTKDKLVMLLVALALGGAYLAIHYEIQPIISLMVGAGGILMLVSGLRMIATRRARVVTQGSEIHPRAEHHTGFTAQLWGILYAMMSIALFGLAYTIWPANNGASDFVEMVSNSPFLTGLVIVVVGAGMAMYGLTRLLARKEAFVETGLSTPDRYFTGIYSSLAGTLILAVGLLQTFAPELLSALRHWMWELIKNAVQRL